jgi:hypothetical protein
MVMRDLLQVSSHIKKKKGYLAWALQTSKLPPQLNNFVLVLG